MLYRCSQGRIVHPLVEAVALGRQAEVDQEGFVEWAGTPAPDDRARMQQYFWQKLPTPRVKLHASFRQLPQGDLLVSGFDLVLRRKG